MNPIKNCTVHGVFINIFGVGTLLSGESGIGKSEIALTLINQGHQLIADDAPLFHLTDTNHIEGQCSPLLQDFLEIKGLGILNIRKLFGDNAIRKNQQLDLIIHLKKMPQIHGSQHLQGINNKRLIMNTPITEITIPCTSERNLALLVECAVRNQILKNQGYHADLEFEKNQQQALLCSA